MQTKGLQANRIERVAEDVRPYQQSFDILLPGNIEEDVFLGFELLLPMGKSTGKADQVDIPLLSTICHPMPQVDFRWSAQPCCQHTNRGKIRKMDRIISSEHQ